MIERIVDTVEDMFRLGVEIAARLNGGEVVELIGDVGAGKTTLTKGIAKGLGVEDDVQSPSFTLSRVYQAQNDRQLVHYDFYRLTDPGILADELADMMGGKDTIVIIEWADIVEGVLPQDRITVHLTSPSESTREVRIEGVSL